MPSRGKVNSLPTPEAGPVGTGGGAWGEELVGAAATCHTAESCLKSVKSLFLRIPGTEHFYS